MLCKVLVPLDGSREAEVIVLYVRELKAKLKAEIVLFQVIVNCYHTIDADGYGWVSNTDQQIASAKAWATDYLNNLGVGLYIDGVAVKSCVRVGIVANEIIRCANEINTNLVAMSTHGRSGVRRLVFGSVADKVLQEGDTPLLLVRPN